MQEFAIGEENAILAVDTFENLPSEAISEYYSIPRYNHLQDRVLDFLHSAVTVAAIIGPKSCGKTALLKNIYQPFAQKSYLVAGDGKSNFPLLIAEHFQVECQDQSIEQLLQKNPEKELWLFVDDAELLPLDIFHELVLAFSKEFCAKVKLILSGDVNLQKRINDLVVNSHLVTPIFFQFEPLTLKEMKAYLKNAPLFSNHREVFNPKMIDKIFDLSNGYIGRINRVVQQVANQKTRPHKPAKARRKFTLLDAILSFGILSLLVILGLRVNTITKETHFTTPLDVPVVALKTKSPTVRVTVPVQPQVIFEEMNTPSFVASIENLPEENLVIKSEPQEVAPKIVVAEKKPVIKPTPVKNLPVAKKYYTVQLMAADQKANLENWMHQFGTKLPLKIVHIERNNKAWFVLTYGNFSSSSEAKQALETLPKEMQTQKPWVRLM